MENKYYKAKLFTCDKDLKFLRKGEVKYSEIANHLIDENINLIIEDNGINTIEYRTKESLPLLYFDKIILTGKNKGVQATDITEDFIANLDKTNALAVAICFKTKMPIITKEEATRASININTYELQARIKIAIKKAEANLTAEEQTMRKVKKYKEQFEF